MALTILTLTHICGHQTEQTGHPSNQASLQEVAARTLCWPCRQVAGPFVAERKFGRGRGSERMFFGKRYA